MAGILIIEDDRSIADLIRVYLQREGYTVRVAADGQTGLRLFGEEPPDLIVLDLMLPGLHGRDVCRAIRLRNATPILMITALDDERDIVEGLDLGADDYIVKPFKPRELVARVRAALRRVSGSASMTHEIVVGDLILQPDARAVSVRNELIELRPKEFDLLLALLARPRIVLTRDQLLRLAWGWDYGIDSRTVDVHINRLRNRLAASAVTIETVRGIGYRIVPPGDL